jgi:hypothetical protein
MEGGGSQSAEVAWRAVDAPGRLQPSPPSLLVPPQRQKVGNRNEGESWAACVLFLGPAVVICYELSM